MKTKILPSQKEISLPKCFSAPIREDLAQRAFEIEKEYHPFAPYLWAGMNYSASGQVKHARKVWKTQYGKGMSRTPQKQMWRRGTQFYWIGAVVTQARGGRRAHPPKVEHFQKELKMNKKEQAMALNSGISATTQAKYIEKRYGRVSDIKNQLPFVVESKMLEMNTKKFAEAIEKMLGEAYIVAFRQRSKRAGKAKMRIGNKSSKGMLLVIGNDEKFASKRFDVRKASELKMKDVYPLGRLAMYTEKAINDLGVKDAA